MARMIPPTGPNAATGSQRAEPDIYWRLREQLPDEFTVIHSLPWLSSVARAIDGRPVPTGEIDFLVLHPDLGLLAFEVKGGVLGYDRTEFVYLRTGERLDPLRQVRRGTHGLAKWLRAQGNVAVRIGYAILLPDSEVKGRPLPPALVDPTISPPTPIVLDTQDLHKLGEKVQGLMRYWRQVLSSPPLGRERVGRLVDLICPEADYTPSWRTRIEYDEKVWLELTPEQSDVMGETARSPRSVITGWPGTGKTLLAISLARRLDREQQSTLFMVYNTLLARCLDVQLKDSPKVRVVHFHGLCRLAAQAIGEPVPEAGADKDVAERWYREDAPLALWKAAEQGKLPEYEALILDEAQVFEQDWLRKLTSWMGSKRIAAFCDETQVFEFEKKTTTAEICSIIGAQEPFTLTLNLRSPRAVFDRLREVVVSRYQQHNPRPNVPDTLSELAVDDPASELREVLARLKSEGVPAEAVTVLYHKWPPPRDVVPGDYRVNIESMARFRGLESPVVVVYAPGAIEDNPLFCAYSRATTRCVVIYSAYDVTKHRCGTFGGKLLDSGQGAAIRGTAAAGSTTGIINRLSLSVTQVVSRVGRVDWCHDWGAWLVPPAVGAEVTAALWLDHLSLMTDKPIYHWDEESRGSLQRGVARLQLTDGLNLKLMTLAACKDCRRITPHTVQFGSPDVCVLCEPASGLPVAEPPEARHVVECDEMLDAPDKVPDDRKLQQPPTIAALGRWTALEDSKRVQLAEAFLNARGSVGYRTALILSGIDIIQTEPGTELLLDNMAKRYYSWSTWMSERLPSAKWRDMVALALSRWNQRQLIESRGKGLYYRL